MALIQFVDSISETPTVRLDVNDGAVWFCTKFKAPPPRLRRSVSQNAMRDGTHVSSSSYDSRTLELELYVLGEGVDDYERAASADMVGAEMQKLFRELDRSNGYLLYQADAFAKPVFFRLYRSDTADLEELWSVEVAKKFTIELMAEPFALGLRESLGPFRVVNDPVLSTANLAAPTLNTATPSTTGGTLAAGTYYYRVTALTSAGETTVSNQVSAVTTGTTSSVALSWGNVPSATGYRVYRSTSAGSNGGNVGVDVQAPTTTRTDTGSATGSATPPAANSTGALGCYFDVTGVVGDVPAPVVIWDNASNLRQAGILTTVPATTNVSFLARQAEAMTMSIDTAVAGSDSAMIGAGANNFARTTFATAANLRERLRDPSADLPRGAYRVLVCVRRSDTTSVITARWYNPTTSVAQRGETVTIPARTERQVVDLGIYNAHGDKPTSIGHGPDAWVEETTLAIESGRTSGTGTVDWDYMLYVPAYVQSLMFSFDGYIYTGRSAAIDSTSETVSAWVTVGASDPTIATYRIADTAKVAGGWPYVSPGSNRFLIHALTTPDAGGVGRSYSWNLSAAYWPQYLFVRPAAS